MKTDRMFQIIVVITTLLILQGKDVWIGNKINTMHKNLVLTELEKRSSGGVFDKTYITSQNVFSKFSFGMEQILSDYYWVKAATLGAVDLMLKYNISPDNQNALEIIEDAGMSEQQKKTMYELVRLSTNYDPHFIYVYEYGSLLLAWEGYTDFATFLLTEGVKKNPRSARLYNSLSFVNYFFLKDYEAGAYYAQKAYETSENGEYSNPKLVAQAYAAGGDYDAALAFLKNLYEKPESQMTKSQIETMVKYIRVEKDIDFLNKALGKFIKKYNVKPLVLEGVVETGIVTEIPQEPFGGKYVLNIDTWLVENEPLKRDEHLLEVRAKDTKKETATMRVLED